MIIRTATKEDAKAFNDLASYCFGDPYEEHALYDEIFDYENTKVVEQDGKLVGGYTLFPFEMNYGAGLAKMGGLSCVVMDVDARYSGFAKTMLTEMLSDMKERGFVFCALGALNIEFYRKLGWEASYDRTHYEIDINVFKPYLTSEYKIEKHYGVPIDEIIPVQTEYAKRYIGYIPRTKKYWQMFDNLIKEAKNLCATVKMDEKTAGYIIYKLHDKKVDVREIVYTSSASLQALFGFIYRHNSQCSKVLMEVPCDFPLRLLSNDLYKVDCKIKTFMMNRVVSVKKAFELG